MRLQITVLMIASLTSAVACGGGSQSIEDACAEAEERGCLQRGIDCSVIRSANFDNLVVASGCSSRLDDVEDCLGGFDDVCEETCGREGDALAACLLTYCNANQDPLCSLGNIREPAVSR